jgi:DNA replication protein DnaD
MGVQDADAKLKLFEETDVLERIINSIGECTYNRILNEIDLGLRYRISTNPETKLLIKEVTNLIKNLTNVSKNVTDDTLNSLLSSVKNVITTVPTNEAE